MHVYIYIYLKLCVALSVEFERLCKVGIGLYCKTYVSPFQCSISSTQVLCCIVNLPIYTKQTFSVQGVYGKPGTSLRHVRVDIYNYGGTRNDIPAAHSHFAPLPNLVYSKKSHLTLAHTCYDNKDGYIITIVLFLSLTRNQRQL